MKWLLIVFLAGMGRIAAAEVCQFTVNATDQMRYDQQTLQVDALCTEVEINLRHTGSLPAAVMGHDWVLTKTADVAAVAIAGMSAGAANNYQQPGDKRIVAATRIVGGGDSATVRFSTAKLERGGNYSYFCSSPGHYSVMKGRFVYKAADSAPLARNDAAK